MAANAASTTYSIWVRNGDYHRGTVDRAFGFDDGSVQRYYKVVLEANDPPPALVETDPRLVIVWGRAGTDDRVPGGLKEFLPRAR